MIVLIVSYRERSTEWQQREGLRWKGGDMLGVYDFEHFIGTMVQSILSWAEWREEDYVGGGDLGR